MGLSVCASIESAIAEIARSGYPEATSTNSARVSEALAPTRPKMPQDVNNGFLAPDPACVLGHRVSYACAGLGTTCRG